MNKNLALLTTLAAALTGCAHPSQAAYLPASPTAVGLPAVARAGAAARASRIYYAGYDASAQPWGAGVIGVFAATATGNAGPLREIKGSNTTLISPEIAILDNAGRLWTCDFNAENITAFAAGATGNATPVVNISGSNVPLNACGGMTLGKNQAIYATSFGSAPSGAPAALAVWPSNANGNVAPQTVYSGSKTQLHEPSAVAINAAGRIYVASGDAIAVFGGTGGNVAPQHSIKGAATTIDYAAALAIDPKTQNVVVASEGNSAILTFAPGAHGNVAPLASIAGSKTSIDNPYGVAIDSAGYIYVGNCPQSGSTHQGSIEVFAPGAHGNVKPVQRIIGNNADMTCAVGLTVK